MSVSERPGPASGEPIKILRLLDIPNGWLICAHMVLRDRTGDKGKRVPRSPLNSHCVQMVIKQCSTSSSNTRFARQRVDCLLLLPHLPSSLSFLFFVRLLSLRKRS